MADEAVLRIKMEGTGSDATGTRSGSGATQSAGGRDSASRSDPITSMTSMISQLGGAFDNFFGVMLQHIGSISSVASKVSGASATSSAAASTQASTSSSAAAKAATQAAATAAANAAAGGGAAAAAGGGAMASIAAIAGPVAIGIAALEAIKSIKSMAVGIVERATTFYGQMIAPDTDPSRVAAMAGSAMKSFGDSIFYINPVLGIFASQLGAGVSAIADFQHAIDGYVHRFSGFAPGVAQAEAQAGVIQVLNDMRRAQESGPELLKYIQERTELQQKFEDLKVRALNKLVPIITAGMDILGDMLPMLQLIVEVIPYTTPGMIAAAHKAAKGPPEKDPFLTLPTDFFAQGQFTPGAPGPQRRP